MNLFSKCIAYNKTYEVEGKWIPNPRDENDLANSRSTMDEGIPYNTTYELEEGEWIPNMEEEYGIDDRSTINEGITTDLNACMLHMYNHLKSNKI